MSWFFLTARGGNLTACHQVVYEQSICFLRIGYVLSQTHTHAHRCKGHGLWFWVEVASHSFELVRVWCPPSYLTRLSAVKWHWPSSSKDHCSDSHSWLIVQLTHTRRAMLDCLRLNAVLWLLDAGTLYHFTFVNVLKLANWCQMWSWTCQAMTSSWLLHKLVLWNWYTSTVNLIKSVGILNRHIQFT